MLESDAPKELLRLSRVLDDETDTIHLFSELFDFAHHHPPDPLPPQLARDDDVAHAHRIAFDLQIDVQFDHGDDVAEELPEQTACRYGGRGILAVQKRADRLMIAAFDGTDEQT